eukprot:COSAG04_NODE_391_length_15160_cov_4.380725_14_plen_76_part_00
MLCFREWKALKPGGSGTVYPAGVAASWVINHFSRSSAATCFTLYFVSGGSGFVESQSPFANHAAKGAPAPRIAGG